MRSKFQIDKEHKIQMILMGVVLTGLYIYYYGGKFYTDGMDPFLAKRTLAFTMGYLVLMYLTFFKEHIGIKVKGVLRWALFCATPFVCYYATEHSLVAYIGLNPDRGPKWILFNIAIYGALLVFFTLLFMDAARGIVITAILDAALFLTMFYVMKFRGVALIMADFLSAQTAANVAGSYDYNLEWNSYLCLCMMMALAAVARRLGQKHKFTWKWRVPAVVVAIGLLLASNQFFLKSDVAYCKVRLWRPQDSYMKFGATYAFVQSGRYLMIEKPEDYSVEKVNAIIKKYEKQFEEEPTLSGDKQPNVIIIMDEAFCDLQSYPESFLETNQEVLPFLNSLKENTTKGYLYSSNLGGGTAITEFEVLTGNTNGFLPRATIAYQTAIKSEQPSLAWQFKNLGYNGIQAFHPYRANSYYRNKAYPLLGFEHFFDETEFMSASEDPGIGANISDKVGFEKIIEEYEKCKKESDAPYFGFEVTMQNHTPYAPVENPEILVTNEGYTGSVTERFLNYTHETDKAMEELISYFENVKEPTVICMYGDHPPNLQGEFYEDMYGAKESQWTDLQSLQVRRTSFYIWSNYDSEEVDAGAISANYLSNYILDKAGVKKTGYQKYLKLLEKQIPAITSNGYIVADGTYYEVEDTTSPYYDLIHEYQILQYNNLVDTKNRVENFFE